MRELYAKSPLESDDYDPTRVEITDPLELYLQQIRLLFGAEPGTVMGAVERGLNLEAEVYEHQISQRSLEQRILQSIQTECPSYNQFDTNCQVQFAKGSERDIVVIDLFVNGRKVLQTLLK